MSYNIPFVVDVETLEREEVRRLRIAWNSKDDIKMHPSSQSTVFPVLGVVTKKPKEMKTAWISGRVNQASLKLYTGFPIIVCWTS